MADEEKRRKEEREESEQPVKKKNAFRDMILIIFAVLICFGLTIYGIIYLTAKVVSPEEKIESAKIKPPSVTTNPEEGDILTLSSKPEKKPENKEEDSGKPVPIRTQQYSVNKDKQTETETPKTEASKESAAKPVAKAEPIPIKIEPEKKSEPVKEPIVQQKPEKKPEPVQTKKSSGKEAWAIQLGASNSKTSAESAMKKYRQSCPDITIQTAVIKNATWYRIRCGFTDNKAEAENTRNRIISSHNLGKLPADQQPKVVSNK